MRHRRWWVHHRMNTIILFLSLALASLAEASIAPQSGPPPFCCGFQKPRKIHIQSLDNSLPMHGALNLRGGGSNIRLPIDNSRILSFVIAFHAFNGVVGLAAPEILAEKVYMYHPVKEGSFAQLCHEFFGAGATSLALTLYLSGDKSTFDAVAIGTLPLAYVTFRHLLKGTSTTLGLHKGAWDVLMAQFFVGIYALLTRVSNTDRIAKIYAMVPTIIGLSGMLDLNYSKALWGIEVIDCKSRGFHRPMLSFVATGFQLTLPPLDFTQFLRNPPTAGCRESSSNVVPCSSCCYVVGPPTKPLLT